MSPRVQATEVCYFRKNILRKTSNQSQLTIEVVVKTDFFFHDMQFYSNLFKNKNLNKFISVTFLLDTCRGSKFEVLWPLYLLSLGRISIEEPDSIERRTSFGWGNDTELNIISFYYAYVASFFESFVSFIIKIRKNNYWWMALWLNVLYWNKFNEAEFFRLLLLHITVESFLCNTKLHCMWYKFEFSSDGNS